MTLESALFDTSYDMELEKIKNKIMKLYTDLVKKTFRMSNPGASQEEIQNFIDENALEFKGDGFSEEADGLEKILDLLVQDEDLDEIKEKKFEKPKVAEGKELKSRHENLLRELITKPLKVPTGGLFTPKDRHSLPKTKAPSIPRGTIKRIIDDDPKVSTIGLKDIWDKELDRLLALVRKRNKEHGVQL
jgi:hypothetical protein